MEGWMSMTFLKHQRSKYFSPCSDKAVDSNRFATATPRLAGRTQVVRTAVTSEVNLAPCGSPWIGSRLPLDGDVLAFGEGKHPFVAAFTAQSALFHPTKRCRRV